MHDTPNAMMPADLPALSDTAAAEILDFLHELVFRFEAHYYVQLRRFYDQQLDLFDSSLPTSSAESDVPF